MSSLASGAASDVHHFTFEFRIAFEVLLVAPRIVLVVIMVALLRIGMDHLHLVFSKWALELLVLTTLVLILSIGLIICHILCL